MVTVEYLNPDISVIDLKIFEDIKYLKSKLDESALKIVSRSNDDNRWLIISYSSFEPSKYYLYTRDSKSNTPVSLKCLFSTQPELDKYQLQKKNPIIIKSRDGLDLVCYLTKSCDFKEGTPSKMLIRVHGGPWGRDNICLNKEVQLFANRGYSVLQINYRGSIGFGKKFTNAANGNLHKIRNDIIDGVNWAIKNKIADKDKIGIIGASFGGYSVLAGLAFTPNVFCCGIDVVGPSNFMTILRTVPKYWKPRMISWYKLIGNPETKAGRSKLLSFSPITRVNSIKKPLMIFQGEHDPRVNRAESDQMVAAMKENGLPVVYVLYSNEGHGFHHEANSKTHQAFTEKFLAKVMGGWYEPIYQGELERSSHQILEGKNLVEN
jgi:dipeptidyl aminopeptidase/acylaminoacyl peptidase